MLLDHAHSYDGMLHESFSVHKGGVQSKFNRLGGPREGGEVRRRTKATRGGRGGPLCVGLQEATPHVLCLCAAGVRWGSHRPLPCLHAGILNEAAYPRNTEA